MSLSKWTRLLKGLQLHFSFSTCFFMKLSILPHSNINNITFFSNFCRLYELLLDSEAIFIALLQHNQISGKQFKIILRSWPRNKRWRKTKRNWEMEARLKASNRQSSVWEKGGWQRGNTGRNRAEEFFQKRKKTWVFRLEMLKYWAASIKISQPTDSGYLWKGWDWHEAWSRF